VVVRALASVQAFASKGRSLEIASTMPTTTRTDFSTATMRVARVPRPVRAEAPAVLVAWALVALAAWAAAAAVQVALVAWAAWAAPVELVAWAVLAPGA